MKDKFTKNWITENAIEIVSRYDDGVLTLRGLHYQLVSRGMTNTIRHYKRVVNAMIEARWEELIRFEKFSDLDRSMDGQTDFEVTSVSEEIDKAKRQIRAWMNNYNKNRWENQMYYPEVFIEKKALQGVFGPVCDEWDVALGACKGYPSLTFLNDAAKRFQLAEIEGHVPIILYFGDYDPSGEDIPRSIYENLLKFGVDVCVRRIALMDEQVVDWNLPPAPAKSTDSRTAKWDGLGQVELDAVEPEKLQGLCVNAIQEVFNEEKFEQLINQQDEEHEIYKKELKDFVKTL